MTDKIDFIDATERRTVKGLSQFAMPSNVSSIRTNPELDNIKSISYEELTALKPEPQKFVLHPWLPEQGIAFIYAASGVGKTLFAMNVSYAIAQGGKFLKFQAPMPRKVLYLDGEMAFSQIHSRFINIVKQQGSLYYPEMWSLLTPDKVLPHKLPTICSLNGQDFYNCFIEKEKIEVLIIDNLSMLSEIDENKSDEWKIIQNWLTTLRSKGLSVIVIHHAGKDKTGYRGTSRMLDSADTAISLQALFDDKLESDDINTKKFKLTYTKTRSFSGNDSLPFEISISDNKWSYQGLEQTTMNLVIERMIMKMSQKEIAFELKVSRPYINKLVQKARKLGLLREE